MNAILSSFSKFGYLWLIVAVCLAAFITAIVRLGNFRKDQKAQVKAELKQAYDMALKHQGDVAKEFGINSPELLAAKGFSMEIFKQMVADGIE